MQRCRYYQCGKDAIVSRLVVRTKCSFCVAQASSLLWDKQDACVTCVLGNHHTVRLPVIAWFTLTLCRDSPIAPFDQSKRTLSGLLYQSGELWDG
jgi:hypothetical protein